MIKKIFIILLFLLISCTNKTEEQEAITACFELCKETNLELKNSPCLSNEIIQDWVCDIAHSPRQEMDNKPENQCSSFREGKTHHFVELDEKCNLIKTY